MAVVHDFLAILSLVVIAFTLMFMAHVHPLLVLCFLFALVYLRGWGRRHGGLISSRIRAFLFVFTGVVPLFVLFCKHFNAGLVVETILQHLIIALVPAIAAFLLSRRRGISLPELLWHLPVLLNIAVVIADATLNSRLNPLMLMPLSWAMGLILGLGNRRDVREGWVRNILRLAFPLMGLFLLFANSGVIPRDLLAGLITVVLMCCAIFYILGLGRRRIG